MRRTGVIAHVLWSALIAAACGRVGFGGTPDAGTDALPQLPDVTAIAPVALVTTCGDALPSTELVAITNDGEAAVEIASASASDGFTVATAMPITIAPGATEMIAVRPPVAVIGTDVDGTVKTGTLTLTARDGRIDVPVEATVRGARIVLTDGAAEVSQLDLTAASPACPSGGVTVKNIGSLAARVDAVAAGDLAVTGFTGATIDAGSSAYVPVRAVTADACSGAATISYLVTGPTCDTTPTVLQATFTITGAPNCSCS